MERHTSVQPIMDCRGRNVHPFFVTLINIPIMIGIMLMFFGVMMFKIQMCVLAVKIFAVVA